MKIAPNASSDVRRARELLVAGAACAAGVAVAFVVMQLTTRTTTGPGALSRPHQHAGLTCQSCHANAIPQASCVSCHEGAAHGLRPGHAHMSAELGCNDCHKAHGEGQMVAFEATGAFVRSGGGAETAGRLAHGAPSATVPLIPLAVCARCHDASSRTDPIASCLSGIGELSQRANMCMDEHKRAGGDSHRFAAWTAAGEVARSTRWVSAPQHETSPWGFAFAGIVSTSAALVLSRRRRGGESPNESAQLAPSKVRHLPMIDPSTCLGCHACVDACPFDVIEVEKFVAVVTRPDDCCGVVLCEQACPNGSLRIADVGAAPPRLVDEHLESVDVKGLFLAGDLTGLPLIKNALKQGAAAVNRITPTKKLQGGELDVVIVGAGPAGLAASLRAKERGLRYATLEQATVAASIQAFPRDKLVYDQPLHMPCEGELWMRECTKEELLAHWRRVVRKHALEVREHHRVVGIERPNSVAGAPFVVRAEDPTGEQVFSARHVIVAIGRRGSPRTLPIDIASGAESKLFYHLADARSFAGKHVLVVGLGDAAMEAAIALASQPGTRVTVCHRGAGFSRGKARNVGEMKSLVARHKIDLLFSTELVALGTNGAELRSGDSVRPFTVDAVLALIGGKPSWDLLERAGVQIVSQQEP